MSFLCHTIYRRVVEDQKIHENPDQSSRVITSNVKLLNFYNNTARGDHLQWLCNSRSVCPPSTKLSHCKNRCMQDTLKSFLVLCSK